MLCYPITAFSEVSKGLMSMRVISLGIDLNTILIFTSFMSFFSYREKFGFPLVLCASENDRASVIHSLEKRIHNTLDQEVKIGVQEVRKIFALRLKRLLQFEPLESKV